MSLKSAQGRPTGRPNTEVLFLAALIVAGGLLVAYDAWHLTLSPLYSRVGPTFFPYAISAGLVTIGLLLALHAFRSPVSSRRLANVPSVLWIIGGLFAQVLLISSAGFSLATGALFAATARGFGRGPLWLNLLIGVGFAFVLYVLFHKGLQLSLPQGPLERLI